MCHQTLIFTAALMIASTRGRRAHVPNTTQYVLIQAPRLIYNSEKCITLLLKKPIYLADLWTMCQVYQYHSTGSTMLIPSTFCKICQNPPHSLADTNTGYALWKRKKKKLPLPLRSGNTKPVSRTCILPIRRSIPGRCDIQLNQVPSRNVKFSPACDPCYTVIKSNKNSG